MAVVVTKEIKKKRLMLAALGVLTLAIVLILYFGLFSGGAPSSPAPAAGSAESAAGGNGPDLDVRVLEDERFKVLRPPPGVPVATSTTGKKNPFSD